MCCPIETQNDLSQVFAPGFIPHPFLVISISSRKQKHARCYYWLKLIVDKGPRPFLVISHFVPFDRASGASGRQKSCAMLLLVKINYKTEIANSRRAFIVLAKPFEGSQRQQHNRTTHQRKGTPPTLLVDTMGGGKSKSSDTQSDDAMSPAKSPATSPPISSVRQYAREMTCLKRAASK